LQLGFITQLFGSTRQFVSTGFGYNLSRDGVPFSLFHSAVIGEGYHAFLSQVTLLFTFNLAL